MKSILKYFVPMTAAVIALVACNKEKDNKVETPKAPELHITVKASPDQLQGDADTKTYIDGTTIKWGTGEYMKIGVFDGSETTFGESSNASADLWDGEPEALFEFSITPANISGEYTYYGLYPASAAGTSSNTNPASYQVILPATQSAKSTSYDPEAYILVAKPESGKTVYSADWDASFRRATALNKITLKNIPEAINKVTITAPTGIYLAGGRHINLTTGSSGDIYDGTETIEINYATELTGGADMVIWFTSWDAEIPVDEHLIIVASSETHSYIRDIIVTNKPITFKEGYLNTLNVNMASANVGVREGDYLILAKNNTNYFALRAEATGERLVSVNYDGSLVSYYGDADMVWSIAISGSSYTVKNSTNYLGWTSGNSASLIAESDYTDAKCLMDITYGEDTYLLSVNDDSSRKLARNTSNEYFAFYGGTQYKDIVFVPATVDARDDVSLLFGAGETVINLTTDDYDSFLGLSLNASPNVAAITDHINWSYEEDPDGVIDEFDDGALTLTGTVGTATVTATFDGDENYRPATASYTINVTSAAISGWVETALADITSDDVFVMVGNGAYALSSEGGSSTNPPAVAVTVDNKKLTGVIADAIKWNLSGNSTDGYTFFPNGLTTKLFCNTNAGSGSNTNLRVGNGGSYNRYVFLLEDDHLVTNDDYTARYIGINGTSDFRGYIAAATNSVTFTFYKYVDSRPTPGMSWSEEEATATYSTGNSLSFTQPTLTLGNASSVTYSSSDETIATINNAGVVSINLTGNDIKEGNTTIKAIFAGDDDYKPQTVSYTLYVVDNRAAVKTPGFDTPAGEVAENTVVHFTCEDSEVTYYYTENGDVPTTSSTQDSAVTIDVAKTVKVIATKTGYKNSAVAEAAYTIEGAVPNDGSLEHPYTADEAYAIISGYSSGSGSDGKKYVTGKVVSVTGLYNGTMLNYYISSDGTATNQIQVFRGKYVADTDFSSADQVQAGDEVIIYGQLYKYNTTIEINTGNYIYSLNGKTKALTSGTLTTSTDDANKQITVTWGAATGTDSAISYVVNCGDQVHYANAAGSHTFTMASYTTYNVSVVASADDAISATASTTATLTDPSAGTSDHNANIKFGSAEGSTRIEGKSSSGSGTVTYTDSGNDSQGNTWTITTVTSNQKSFTQQATYSQIGASTKPVSSITFTTTLSKSATIKSFSAKFGGFSNTAGAVTLKVGSTTVGSGNLNGTSDVTVNATNNTAVGTELTITVTGISKGVKAYEINVTYNN